MTTNCGSFKPAPRATRVAAGIPTRVTIAAAMIVAHRRSATGIREHANAHRITVATDPHVPGPGLSRPRPKNVATSVAQTGAALFGELGPEAVSDGRITRRPRRCCLAGRLHQHRRPETKSRILRWPTCRDRSGGNGRCKKGSPRPRSWLPSYRWGSGA